MKLTFPQMDLVAREMLADYQRVLNLCAEAKARGSGVSLDQVDESVIRMIAHGRELVGWVGGFLMISVETLAAFRVRFLTESVQTFWICTLIVTAPFAVYYVHAVQIRGELTKRGRRRWLSPRASASIVNPWPRLLKGASVAIVVGLVVIGLVTLWDPRLLS